MYHVAGVSPPCCRGLGCDVRFYIDLAETLQTDYCCCTYRVACVSVSRADAGRVSYRQQVYSDDKQQQELLTSALINTRLSHIKPEYYLSINNKLAVNI